MEKEFRVMWSFMAGAMVMTGIVIYLVMVKSSDS